MTKQIIVISGPTAAGKTTMALQLARWLKVPVVSADSRQIFEKVNIGTAKPTKLELQEVQHYFIDHISVEGQYSAGQYQAEASAIITDLLRVYRHVLICEGTGLYLRAITSGLDDLPATDNEIRKSVQIGFEAQGISFLQEFIKENDPVYFNEVDLNNIRRLTRAVEVIRQTGKPFSYFRKGFQAPGKDAIVTEINLTLDRTSLYARIDQRVDQMMQQGLLDEARKLILFRECQALKTVGYNELFEYLDGKCSLDEAVNKIKQHTRNYAKRQITWFRKFNTGEVLYPDELEQAKSFVL